MTHGASGKLHGDFKGHWGFQKGFNDLRCFTDITEGSRDVTKGFEDLLEVFHGRYMEF